MSRLPPLLLGLVLLAPALALLAPASEAATTRVLTISTATAGPTKAFAGFDADPPKLFDFNGDGKLEIIEQNDDRGLYVFDSQTGKLLAELTTSYPAHWGARPLNGPEAAIMVKGGVPHLIVSNSAAILTDFAFDPAHSTATHFVFTKAWERRLSDCHSNPGQDSKPVLADLDRDGRLEVLIQTEEVGVYAVRSNGQLMWKDCIGGGNGEPGVGDLDNDGWPEVVWCSDGGVCTATSGRTGAIKWSYNVLHHFNVGSGSMPVGPAIAQLDGVGGPDVVVGVRDSHDASNWSRDHAMLLALDSNGHLLWARQPPGANPLTYTHPIVADVDGDGKPDVLWGDWNTIGHKPPFNESVAWKATGPAHYYRFDSKGNLKWTQTLATFWSNKDLALADVNGDGVQDLLVNGPNGGQDGIWYLNSVTGDKEAFVTTWPWKVTRGPVVADLWGTGTMQWVVPAFAYGPGSSGGSVLVYDTHQPYSAMWPHLPYPDVSSVNVTTSGGGTGDGGGSGLQFAPVFELSPNVGAWWEEVKVRTTDPLQGVAMQVDGGAWQPLSATSWGTWARSLHVPAGAQVQFRAQNLFNQTALSGVFTWLSGGGGGAPGSFAATFHPHSVGNDWWVEVRVDTASALAGVDARLDGGAWQPLTLRSWGAWARSLHAPNGTVVEFRARDDIGNVATSAPVTWA